MRYLVGCGCNDTHRQGEDESQRHSQNHAPVRKLQLPSEAFTSEDGDCKNQKKKAMEPPLRDSFIVLPHQPSMYVSELVLKRGLRLHPYISALSNIYSVLRYKCLNYSRWKVLFYVIPPMKKGYMRYCGSQDREAQTIDQYEEYAQVYLAVAIIRLTFELEGFLI